MKKLIKTIIFFTLLYPLALLAHIDFNTSTVDYTDDPTLPNYYTSKQNQDLSFSTQNFGFTGPLTLGGIYSQNYGFSLKGQWSEGLGIDNAVSLLFELGTGQTRFNGSVGHAFTPDNRLKLSAEYLQQNINFDFDSGDVKERLGQGAYGLTYQYLVANGFFHDINFNAFYSNAASKNFDNIIFKRDSYIYENFRHIAGGIDKSASVGITLKPLNTALLGLTFNYDNITYDKIYDKHDEDAVGFGATLTWQQLLSNSLKLKLTASSRKPTSNYEVELGWLCPTELGSNLEFTLLGSYLSGSNGLPNDNKLTLNVNYSFGGTQVTTPPFYTLGVATADENLVHWTSIPAVYMHQVLAVKDQMTKLISKPFLKQDPIPVTGTVNQPISIDITDQIVFGSSKLKRVYTLVDGALGEYGLKIGLENEGTKVIVSGTPRKPAAAVYLEIVVENLAGETLAAHGHLLLNIKSSPIILSVDPFAGPDSATNKVIVTGTNFVCEGLSVSFGGELVPHDNCDDTKRPNVITINNLPYQLSKGIIDVRVDNADGSFFDAKRAYIFAPLPSIVSFLPVEGKDSGDVNVTLKGSGFMVEEFNVTKHSGQKWGVYLSTNGLSHPSLTTLPEIINKVSHDTIIFTTTPHSPGIYYIWVYTAGGWAVSQETFTIRPSYSLTIAPSIGSVTGNTPVVITSTGGTFDASAIYKIKFDGEEEVSPDFGGVSANKILLHTPEHSVEEFVDVVLYVNGVPITVSNKFRYANEFMLLPFDPPATYVNGSPACIKVNVANFDISSYPDKVGVTFSWFGSGGGDLFDANPDTGKCPQPPTSDSFYIYVEGTKAVHDYDAQVYSWVGGYHYIGNKLVAPNTFHVVNPTSATANKVSRQ